ncbi:hypothetical protein L596_017698 [Steinernema carpocapsae]|uniref:Uncharacterized protein n=1 Tax=Steinernema carpocapsae TaxID=34508 RepID=A0A4U5N2T0_STECR|nr:hypothetical protein L596_017698 [Steinernema carpocapsae]
MDQVPILFVEAVLFSIAVHEYVTPCSRLSGNFGLCAKQLNEKEHQKCFSISSDLFNEIYFTDKNYYDIDPETGNLPSKWRTRKYVEFDDDDVFTSSNEGFQTCLQKFLKEPGMLCLLIDGISFDVKWVEVCSAWGGLRKVEIHIRLRLVQLSIEDKEKFSGCKITWYCYIKLHDESFERMERVNKKTISYKKETTVVRYYNYNGTFETTDDKFMENVRYCEMEFIESL